jgi:hypothetical protein
MKPVVKRGISVYEDAHLESEYDDRNGGVTEYDFDDDECLDWCAAWNDGECDC